MKKNIRSAFVTLIACFLMSGCQAAMYGTAENLNKISIGMPKQQVVQELGTPDTTSATDNEEILKYKWMKTVVSWAPIYFYVRLVDGKVQSYGEERDLKKKL